MSMTAAERVHLSRVANLGCIVCGAPAQIHHPRYGQGMGMRAPHCDAIGLCYDHHQGRNGIHTLGTRVWQQRFGTEMELLAQVRETLQIKEEELAT